MLEQVQTLLVAGRGATPGITAEIKGGVMPNTPDTLISLYDQSAFEPERAFHIGVVWEVRNLQILTRDFDPLTAEQLANQCFDILDNFVGVLLTVSYAAIIGRQVPFGIGPDENRRYRFSCNYRVTKGRG